MTEVYTIFRITTLADGRARIESETNDDDDDGVPGELTNWSTETTMPTAKSIAGVSRIGIFGHEVTVYLDGEKI